MPLARFELFDDHVRLHFTGERIATSDVHHRWLRQFSDLDRHPLTNERQLDSSDLPDHLAPRAVSIEGDGSTLVVDWPGTTALARYAASFLVAHAYGVDRPAVAPPPSDVDALIVAAGPELAARVLARTESLGAAVVRGAGDDTESLIDAFEALGLRTIATHFGRIEDLRTDNTTNQNTDQLGYTDAAIDLHTDQPFLEHPPRYQLLHCLRPATQGGDTRLADALAASRFLAAHDRPAHDRLTTTPVTFHRKQKSFEAIQRRPLITPEGTPFQVRSSYFTVAPYAYDFAETAEWYRAHDRFIRLVRDPRFQYRLRLEAGDFVLYDNHRMLHARTAFTGARWLRGVYFDRAD